MMLMLVIAGSAMTYSRIAFDDETEKEDEKNTKEVKPRWKVQKTTPVTYDDLQQKAADLEIPENLKQEIEYNDTLERYIIGTKMGNTWVAAPIMMDRQEFTKWTEKHLFSDYFRQKNSEIFEKKGKEKFDFTDMHFDLGPAEKIFGPGGIRIKTQGTAELKLGATLKNIDNPSLPIRNRKTTTIDFDEKINLNVTGSIGDKMRMNLNYNTDATFDYDAQNLKLKYEGKEDEIIKLVEAGNVSFPSNSSLIQGAQSLFGIRTDMQFGKLKLQTVVSQKKSTSSSVSSKGGTQTTPFELNVANYEENRHFFMGMYFRENYDRWMATLPTPTTGITINRVEVWVTNKTGTSSNTRDILAFADLGESASSSDPNRGRTAGTSNNPSNPVNSMYSQLTSQYVEARNVSMASEVLASSGFNYEKIEKARLLSSSEYTVNNAMGYISLKTSLQTDQVLAIAYEYTYNGVTYQVGEFSSDVTDVSSALFVKSLKNSNNTPSQPNWSLMMRNVYYLAASIQKEKFKLDIKYQSDSIGVYVNYIPESQVKSIPLIRLLGADRLDANNRIKSNGYFDFVEGYTISNGRVFLPKAEPFGSALVKELEARGAFKDKYIYQELYDTTKTAAKSMAEKNRYKIVGQFKGSAANVISLGAYNVPHGSVVVTAGGVILSEGSDYSVDYSAGEVTILNQSIIDAGTSVNVSLESDTDYGMQRKTMFGVNWEYDFSKDLQLSGTFQHLSEQSLTSKVTTGSEPMSNTLVGFNINWKKESQWLTNVLDKIPFLHVKEPSQIQFNAEFAKLFSKISSGTQDNASYIDDFESSTNNIDIATPGAWTLSSVPTRSKDVAWNGLNLNKGSLESGKYRARLAWYYVDPLFTRRSSTLTPAHIKNDLEQLSNHYVREVYVSELYPNRSQSTYSGATTTLNILNLAYYPKERGPYNFNTELDENGKFQEKDKNLTWGGMMRKLDQNNFEEANIEYIEFWMMDPFIYHSKDGTSAQHTGRLHFNLGDLSEDILLDGKKFYESGLPVSKSSSTRIDSTTWGKIPVENTVTYAFATTSGSRALQDLGFNGLNDTEELGWPGYADFANRVTTMNEEARTMMQNDLAGDNYHYFRGTDWDDMKASILDRYKFINNPQGNSPDSDNRTESYDTSYKTTPDVEDINQDYTLNESENYYDYVMDIDPAKMSVAANNYIVDTRDASVGLRNGNRETVRWYQVRIPINSGTRIGSISDFSSVRFMRVYMEGFEEETILRLADFSLVRGDWRIYDQQLSGAATKGSEVFSASVVGIEANNEKKPVNYVLPPGISRVVDPSQPQLTENNEQAMRFDVFQMGHNAAVAVYKNTNYDMRYYKRLQMFAHANALEVNTTDLQNNQLALFVRLGSDYNNNYYEYEIPLKLTPPGKYNGYVGADCAAVWPKENMLDLDFKKLTKLKKERNLLKSQGKITLNQLYSEYDSDNQANKLSIKGNPSLGNVSTMMIGVRNLSSDVKDGEIWVNELRLLEPESEGGWAAAANLNVQLSDLGSVQASGKYISDGFGGLEQKVTERTQDKYGTYSITTSLELGKFFPEKAKVTIPFYYSVTKERTSPKYNPLDTDMLLEDALESAADKNEKDSIESIAVAKTVNRNLSLSGVRFGIATKRHPMPYDPANFSFSYSHSTKHSDGQTLVYDNELNWRGAINYSWVPVYKPFEPFKKWKTKSKYAEILKKWAFNYMPQNISANTEMTRSYTETLERDLENLENVNDSLVTYSSQFLWNRDLSIRWDLTKNLHLSFQSATRAEIEEPKSIRQINKDLAPDDYAVWKDSVWHSIKHMGSPLDYNQNFNASYKLPLNMMPIFDWLNADGTYSATYHWARGSADEYGEIKYGHTITSNRTININSSMAMEKLYNHIPFLKKVNEKFNKSSKSSSTKKTTTKKKSKTELAAEGEEVSPEDAKKKVAKPTAEEKQAQLLAQQKKNTFSKLVTIPADTSMVITHGKKTKRIIVSAKDEDGKTIPIKFKKVDQNKIMVFNKSDSAVKMKVSVLALEPLDDKGWYKAAQYVSRFAMMIRNISASYRNQYSLTLPGFMNNVGDVFGQKNVSDAMSPGLDFAFGFIGDDYIEKARSRGWLLSSNEDYASPATTSRTEDLQIKFTLEPFKNLKIDMNMAHTHTRSKSIQYMYDGNPTTHSGTFSMTTISISSALAGMGNADNGFHSAAFEDFCGSLEGYRQRVQAQYENTIYPEGTTYAGTKFNADKTPVELYSADVMIPAFLNAYTGYKSLKLFPTIARMLPNWTMKYSGLSNLPWFRDHFKSFNINHGYKSIYAVGAYSSYSTYKSFMGEGIGFITSPTTGNPVPNSMFNISTVSINEAFSPLLGLDFTLPNNLTFKAEYRTTRVMTLSMTSVQLNETLSKDWVFGVGYKINDFRFIRSKAKMMAAKNSKNNRGDRDDDSKTSKSKKSTQNNKSTGFAHDLNLRLDISWRKQAAITRDIATISSQATSGNNAFKLAFTADYSLSRLLTMSFYYDRQSNTPLLSSSSYPTVTQDFGLSMKFSLTR